MTDIVLNQHNVRRLPPGWVRATLEDVASWGSGGTPRAGNRRYYGGGIPWAVIGDLNDATVYETANSITTEGLKESSARLVPAGTVLIAMYGSIGKLGIAGVEMATNQAIGFARSCSGVESRFLFWYLRSQRGRLGAAGKGATQKNISQTILRPWPIAVPPLNEQRRIVAAIEEHLSRLDAADASLAAAFQRSESMRIGVLNSVFGPIKTASRLGEVADTQLGKMLSAKSRTGVGSRPYLRNKNVQWGRIDRDDLLEMDFSDRDVERFLLRAGDVLVCEGGEVGRAAVWSGELEGCCYQKALHRVRVHDGLLAAFLVHVFRWMADSNAFDRFVTGSTIKHLPQEDLRMIPIPLPPLDEQRRIVAQIEQQLSAIGALRAAIERAQRRSASLRRAVLNRAFRGELVPQDPSDEPAEALLARIRAERAATPALRRPRTTSREAS